MHLTYLSSYLTLWYSHCYANCRNCAINLVWVGVCFICWAPLHKLLKTIAIYITHLVYPKESTLKLTLFKNLYFDILLYLFILEVYYQFLMYIESFYCKYLNRKLFKRFSFLFPFFIRDKTFQEMWLLYCLLP